ncbi:MAG: VCBS repeat-containing protein [Bacteroidetes bacterium]|nr:VCBS repeat-containing protein [Bacteroidota bacterium]
MTTKTKRILIISGLAILVLAAGSYVMKSKIMGLIKGNDNKRVAAQQSADIKEIPWTATENTNQAMIDYLHKVYDAVNKPGLRFMNTAIAESLLALPIPEDATGKYQWYFDVCNQLLNCGRVNEAVAKIDEFEKSAQFKKLSDAQYGGWYYTKGLVYLRYGEVENCIGLHNAESCIWPLSKAAQSMKKDGPTMAVKAYTDCLKYEPENLSAMWLMNIAYQQLGTYPEAVPAQWLIKPESFKSEFDVPRFKNVAIDLGVDNPNMCGGVILDDFNNDDLIDIFTCGWGLKERSFLLLNKGDGTFDDISKKAGLDEYPGGLMIQQTDYNNDGWLDVWVSRGAWYSNFGILPSSLLRNNGDSTFTDVTREVGIWTTRPSQAATWADFNNDGWLDLYIGNEASRKGDKINDCQLWINEKGKFREIAKEAGINVNSFVKGVTSGDYDNDGDADVYISANGFKKLFIPQRH